jgi:NADPH:quinone reductase-like Zn-dependent oxidoreductase
VTIPTTMRAARIHAFGGPDMLVVEDLPVPELEPGEVLVEVHGASVNGADLELRRSGFDGYYSPPRTLGLDVCGVVRAVADDVEGLAVGDRVHGRRASAARGTYSTYAAVDAGDLVVVPDGIDDVTAAAVPLVGLAAWQSVVEVGRAAPGERVLIHGAGGGVGHLATQFALHLGAHVIASDAADVQPLLERLGVTEIYDFRSTDVIDAVGTVDLVIDPVGGPVTDASLAALGAGGRLVTLVGEPDEEAARARGATATSIDSWMDRGHLARIDELVLAGEVTVEVAEVLPLEQASRAHELAESASVHGKVVLDPRR